MPIQSIDTTEQIAFAASGDSWLIKAGVAVVVSDTSPAIYSNLMRSFLTNQGTVMADVAVFFDSASDFSLVLNASEGVISGGVAGVIVSSFDTSVQNHGAISAQGVGVEVDGDFCPITNDGTIFGGEHGVIFGADGTLDNAGSVASGNFGVALGSNNAVVAASVQNSGSLRGSDAAFTVEGAGSTLDLVNTGAVIGRIDLHNAGASTIVNTGAITGEVMFGAAGDSYDGRGGTIAGLVSGGSGADRLIGGGGGEDLDGGKGVDRIKGMDGDDTITGGQSRDNLNGGRGDDLFVYAGVSDSTPTDMDVIAGWDAGDVIDLSAVDASASAGFQHLVFAGMIAAGDPLGKGKVQFFELNGDTFVVADVTGDKVADFEIQISGTVALNAADFVL